MYACIRALMEERERARDRGDDVYIVMESQAIGDYIYARKRMGIAYM